MNERLEDIWDDPDKRARVFKASWIISYGMLMLGAFIIVGVLARTYLF